MNRQDLINSAATKTKYSKLQLDMIFEAFLETIKDALEDGQEVKIKGFGTFSVMKIKERKAFDLTRNQVMTIPEGLKIKFKKSGKPLISHGQRLFETRARIGLKNRLR